MRAPWLAMAAAAVPMALAPVSARAADEGPDASSGDARDGSARDKCPPEPVTIVRAYTHPPEHAELQLTRCNGEPHRDALDELSLLARPHGVDRPSERELEHFRRRASRKRRKHFVYRRIKRLHPGLLERLQAIADRFGDQRIAIVSGYRPDERHTSRHYHGRALDIRVSDVHRRRVARFAKRHLDRSGVGFYPNSVFTHIDVRQRAAYWIDRSGPGEPADYGPWPPKKQQDDEVQDEVLAQLDRALDHLDRKSRADPPQPDRSSQPDGASADDGVGGIVAATGVRAAWSAVPEQEPRDDGSGATSGDGRQDTDELAGAADAQEPSSAPAPDDTSDPSTGEAVRRMQREAVAAVNRLDDELDLEGNHEPEQ